MKGYSREDLRRKIVAALKRGTSKKSEAARLFGVSGVSLSSVKRFAGMDRGGDGGDSLAPGKPPGRPRKAGGREEKLLAADLADRPAATTSERRRYLEHLTSHGRVDERLDGEEAGWEALPS